MKNQNLVQRLIRLIGLVALLLAFHGGTAYAACSGTCAADSDCAAKSCVYCNTDFGVCSDCCEFVDAASCPTACTFTSGECRNVAGTSCVGLPEVPPSSPKYLDYILLLGLVGIAWFGKKRLSKKPTDLKD